MRALRVNPIPTLVLNLADSKIASMKSAEAFKETRAPIDKADMRYANRSGRRVGDVESLVRSTELANGMVVGVQGTTEDPTSTDMIKWSSSVGIGGESGVEGGEECGEWSFE